MPAATASPAGPAAWYAAVATMAEALLTPITTGSAGTPRLRDARGAGSAGASTAGSGTGAGGGATAASTGGSGAAAVGAGGAVVSDTGVAPSLRLRLWCCGVWGEGVYGPVRGG